MCELWAYLRPPRSPIIPILGGKKSRVQISADWLEISETVKIVHLGYHTWLVSYTMNNRKLYPIPQIGDRRARKLVESSNGLIPIVVMTLLKRYKVKAVPSPVDGDGE